MKEGNRRGPQLMQEPPKGWIEVKRVETSTGKILQEFKKRPTKRRKGGEK